MDLRQYERAIAGTTRDDWTIITCWGFGSGPSYLERSSVWTTGKGEFSNLEIQSHGLRASLKNDLAIWIAWGFPANPEFKEPWANQFPDSSASSAFIDFFFGSALVYRDVYVSVDGGRCKLPLPDLEFDPKTHEVRRYTVSHTRHGFFRLLDTFERLSDFDRYFAAAGFIITDAPWMG